MEEEERDSLYVSLAVALSKGELDLEAVQRHLDDLDLKRFAQAEDVKMQLRGALLGARMFDDHSGLCAALVAREVALRCQDRSIFYGLEFGSSDAVAAADYVAALLLLRQGKSGASGALLRLAELAQITLEQEDAKGAVEALATLGCLTFSLENYNAATQYFREAIDAVADLPPDGDLTITFSSQEMVRNDNRNIFNFDAERFVPEIVSSPSTLCFLKERLASSLLQSGRFPEALQFSDQALQLWRDHLRAAEPAAGVPTLITHALLLAVTGDLADAQEAARELISLEDKLALPSDRRVGSSLLAKLR